MTLRPAGTATAPKRPRQLVWLPAPAVPRMPRGLPGDGTAGQAAATLAVGPGGSLAVRNGGSP